MIPKTNNKNHPKKDKEYKRKEVQAILHLYLFNPLKFISNLFYFTR